MYNRHTGMDRRSKRRKKGEKIAYWSGYATPPAAIIGGLGVMGVRAATGRGHGRVASSLVKGANFHSYHGSMRSRI
jgi:hypothetical protein